MAIPHASVGVPVDLHPEAEDRTVARTIALVKNEVFEAIRLVVPRDHEVCHNHQVEGMLTLQCLEGRVLVTVDGDPHELPAGHWLFLSGGIPHAIKGLENALVLLTVMFR